MADRKLKLVKSKNNRTKLKDEKNGQKLPASQLTLTPAEAAKEARQVMLHRIMAELKELDEISPAA
jgi:hypothetical protein